MLAAVLALLIAASPTAPPPAPAAVAAVPDEPGAFFLPEAPTYQAVAADLDGDGAQELIRLVRASRGAILAEAWTEAGAGWSLLDTVQVVPEMPSGGTAEVIYAGAPVRLVVRRVGDRERVSLVRQPRFQEPGIDAGCCLLIDDVMLQRGELLLGSVAQPSDGATDLLAIDLDGDGTDEIVTSRPIPPLDDIEISVEMSVMRWLGDRFGPPVATRLPLPPSLGLFSLGDSDGAPGDEIGLLGGTLVRVASGAGDSLRAEDSGLPASEAIAVPLSGGRGIALIGGGVTLHSWPPREPPGAAIGVASIRSARLLGLVADEGSTYLLVHQSPTLALHRLRLPDLSPLGGVSVVRSEAAAALDGGPIEAYVGALPGSPEPEAGVLFAGRLVPSADASPPGVPRSPAEVATLAATRPIGLVGTGGGWLALMHGPFGFGSVGPRGGPLDAPSLQPGSGVSLAPMAAWLEPEADAAFEPPISATHQLDNLGTIAVDSRGLVARISAPPGSRVYVADADPSVPGSVRLVPSTGVVDVAMVPPDEATESGRVRMRLAVVTAAGHAYSAGWGVRVLAAPPALEASVATAIGSPDVIVSGTAAPYAAVNVAGRSVAVDDDGRFEARVPLPPWPTDVHVSAVDPVGNQATVALSGVGILDYRGLPWIPLAVVMVGLAAAVLVIRVPHLRAEPRRAADDAILEELDPD